MTVGNTNPHLSQGFADLGEFVMLPYDSLSVLYHH